MFTEAWKLHTHPSTPQGSRQVQFRGAAVAPNVQGRERRKLASMLAEKEKHAKVYMQLLWQSLLCHVQMAFSEQAMSLFGFPINLLLLLMPITTKPLLMRTLQNTL